MILNMADIRSTGSQVGDELWEKLWENEVLAEAMHVKLAPDTVNILGQAQVKDVHSTHAHQQSSASRMFGSVLSLVAGVLSSAVIFLL